MGRTTVPGFAGLCIVTLSSLLLSLPRASHAQCAFDAPAKAKTVKSSLVRHYGPCPPISSPTPNTTTVTGVPACTPPFPGSLYQFDDDKGSCTVRVSQSVETPCLDEIAPSCSVVTIVTKCKGVLDPDGFTPTNTSGWTLNVIGRASLNDTDNGDMTVIDYPTMIELPTFDNGAVKSTIRFGGPCDGVLCDPFGPSVAPPPCFQNEIISIALRDPSGNPFAKLGSSGR